MVETIGSFIIIKEQGGIFMMRMHTLLLGVLLTFSLSVPALAGSKQLTGQVISINKKNHTTVTVKAVDKTKVIVERNTEFSDVKVGDKVTIKYNPDEKINTAKSIEIRAQSHKR
jgi:hypothetical protein